MHLFYCSIETLFVNYAIIKIMIIKEDIEYEK